MNTLSKVILSSLLGFTAFSAQAETRAEIDTNMGKIILSLDEQKAPKTVENFVSYARKGFYNGTIFHRVIDGFMIQGGGFTPEMAQKATDKAINNEADNGLKNTVGTIAMARTASPHSATSQFFINVVFFAVRWFMRSRTRGSEPAGAASPGLALQGAGAGAAGQVLTPKQYRPENVGNDASARPWESQQSTFDAVTQHQQRTSGGGIRIGSALQNDATWSIPADFDRAGFEAAAKRNFITLQNAWDRADISSLRAMMTDGMVHEIQQQLAERERESGGRINTTEVLALDARLLGIEELADEYMASVEFTGTIKEDPAASPSPFREVWNMVKPRNGSAGWLVAGVQALQ